LTQERNSKKKKKNQGERSPRRGRVLGRKKKKARGTTGQVRTLSAEKGGGSEKERARERNQKRGKAQRQGKRLLIGEDGLAPHHGSQ